MKFHKNPYKYYGVINRLTFKKMCFDIYNIHYNTLHIHHKSKQTITQHVLFIIPYYFSVWYLISVIFDLVSITKYAYKTITIDNIYKKNKDKNFKFKFKFTYQYSLP